MAAKYYYNCITTNITTNNHDVIIGGIGKVYLGEREIALCHSEPVTNIKAAKNYIAAYQSVFSPRQYGLSEMIMQDVFPQMRFADNGIYKIFYEPLEFIEAVLKRFGKLSNFAPS